MLLPLPCFIIKLRNVTLVSYIVTHLVMDGSLLLGKLYLVKLLSFLLVMETEVLKSDCASLEDSGVLIESR